MTIVTNNDPAATREIHELSRRFMEAFEHGDAAAVASLYSKDAYFLPAGAPMARGREEIQRAIGEMMSAGVARIDLSPEHVGATRDAAHEIGTVEMTIRTDGQEPLDDPGKYMTLWRREEAGWKIHAGAFNRDSPPAPE